MPAYKYSYGKSSGLFKNPAEVAGPICDALEHSPGGLTPKNLLEASRPEDAPLHNEFEWDDSVAAEKYRIEQAHCIIRHLVRVEVDDEEPQFPKKRAFVYTGVKTVGYVKLSTALSNETWKNNLMKAARRDMEYFVAKYHQLDELSAVLEAMQQILSKKDAG